MQFSVWRLLVVVTIIAVVMGILRFLPRSLVATISFFAVATAGATMQIWIYRLATKSKSQARSSVLKILAVAVFVVAVLAEVAVLVLSEH